MMPIIHTLALTLMCLSSVGASDHFFHTFFDRRLLEVHELSHVDDLVAKHHAGIKLQQTEANIPILGCGPSLQLHGKMKQLAALSSFSEVASVLHDEDETCIIAHVKGSDVETFNE
jgi:hypothetical protein